MCLIVSGDGQKNIYNTRKVHEKVILPGVSIPTTMKKNSEGTASDGELYFITDLLFASNRWGNNTGIDYYKEARQYSRYDVEKDGTGNIFNIINTEHKQITFIPEASEL